ncbi:MAG TPA: hypothetical protein VF756_04890 [Thermoanaerobaculia bacterium]
MARNVRTLVSRASGVIAILTPVPPTNLSSLWVNQEIGFAKGVGKPVLVLRDARLGVDHGRILGDPEFIEFTRATIHRCASKVVKQVQSQIVAQPHRPRLIADDGLRLSTGLIEYAPKLKMSTLHPRYMIDMIRIGFDFMGHGASKWTVWTDKLERALKAIQINGFTARFLLLDPECDDCPPDKQIRILNSLLLLKGVLSRLPRHSRKPAAIIRLYNHRPVFRLAFINHSHVAVGHYMKYTDESIDTPLLVFETKAWSFFTAFQDYFEHEWSEARSLSDRTPALRALARRHGLRYQI